MATGEFCKSEKQGHVLTVTINRPEVMNALHAPANAELAAIWDEFAEDDDLWIGVLTGEGERAFSAGNDLKYTAEMSRLAPEDRPVSRWNGGFGGITNRFDLFKPLVARVNGFALGGGFEMAMACDVIVAADHAELGLPEPLRGLMAGAMGVHRLPRQMPLKNAMGYMLTGRHMSAARAYELGIVNEVVSLSDLDDAVDSWVGDVLRCAPLSVRASKEASMLGLDMSLPKAGSTHFEWESRRRESEDAVEGPRAFAEKRSPNWIGR